MCLGDSCKVNARRFDRRKLRVVSEYAPTVCGPDAIKDTSCQKLHDVLRTARRDDIVILATDIIAQIVRESTIKVHLGGHCGLDYWRSEKGEQLLVLCLDHHESRKADLYLRIPPRHLALPQEKAV